MDQLKNLADDRLLSGCTYCDNGPGETRDHVPSRILLDPPYPSNLPAVPACYPCNNSLSRDEEYLACLIESVIVGSIDPDKIQRPQIARILRRSAALRARIEAAKRIADGRVAFVAEDGRVENVVRKLARGHAAFELSSPLRQEPTSLRWCQISMMTAEQSASFDAPHVVQLFGEIGSRGMQRSLVTQVIIRDQTGAELSTHGLVINDWVDVQDGRYRYLAVDDVECARIRIVINEFLGCEVSWDKSG